MTTPAAATAACVDVVRVKIVHNTLACVAGVFWGEGRGKGEGGNLRTNLPHNPPPKRRLRRLTTSRYTKLVTYMEFAESVAHMKFGKPGKKASINTGKGQGACLRISSDVTSIQNMHLQITVS